MYHRYVRTGHKIEGNVVRPVHHKYMRANQFIVRLAELLYEKSMRASYKNHGKVSRLDVSLIYRGQL